MKKLFLFIFSFYFLFLTFPLLPTFASEPPSIVFREIQPLSTPDSVILECIAETDLSQIIVGDLDGTDTPITSTATTCTLGETVQLIWDTVMPSETKADHTFLSIDTALTNTKDQIVIQKPDGTLLDAVIYWDGASTFASTTEQPDIDKILTAGLWSGGNGTDALIVEANKVMKRTDETHQKTSWEEGNWERPINEEEDTSTTDLIDTDENEEDDDSIVESNSDSDSDSNSDSDTNTETDTNLDTDTNSDSDSNTTNDTSTTSNEQTSATSTETATLVVSAGNSANDPIQNPNTTVYHSTNGSKKSPTAFSPQTNYANEPTRWSLPDDYGLYITSILPQSSKKDFVRFFNPTKSEKNLSSYILSANNKKILLPRLSMKPQSYADALVELPNTKAKLHFFIEGIQVQEIGYESSKKDEYFIFSKEQDSGLGTKIWKKLRSKQKKRFVPKKGKLKKNQKKKFPLSKHTNLQILLVVSPSPRQQMFQIKILRSKSWKRIMSGMPLALEYSASSLSCLRESFVLFRNFYLKKQRKWE